MASTFSEKDSKLIDDLFRLSKSSPKLVRSSEYAAPADPNIIVRSWKMNEYKYYDIPSPFPTLARGLFSSKFQNTDGEDKLGTKHRIVARGYDKFFNISEVPWTSWESLEARTTPPYVLSLKSNGCIIFIAALTRDKLLITSKHSIGGVDGSEMSHAQAGEMWLRRYLERKDRSEAELAATLWDNNWTAVAELCDDSFEEHVLKYSPEKTGLHLHGINTCTKEFKTLPHNEVDAFADEWGFIKTPTVVLDNINDVREFTSRIAEQGEWNGEPVEGFVVRTHVGQPLGGKTVASPYPPGSTLFFKIKFDEPYLMYRDWREVTKMLLSKGLNASSLPKQKMKRKETKLYVNWVIQEIKRDRSQFAEYTHGKGIIAVRERFLEWLQSEQGKSQLKVTKDESDDTVAEYKGNKKFGKTIIVPVAIPGSGKTSVSIALAHIFGFAHTQSDDVPGKKAANTFIKNVMALLKDHDVVIADKNNHLRQHREALRDATSKMTPPVRLLALNWALDPSPATIHRICSDRILQRGSNHQKLHGDKESRRHEDLVWMFISQAEALSVLTGESWDEVDAVVEMQLEETLGETVRRAVDGCVRILGLPYPENDVIRAALNAVEAYSPKLTKGVLPKKEKIPDARYYAILPEIDLCSVLEERIPKEGSALWTALKTGDRIARRPHVTIVHSKEQSSQPLLWEQCQGLCMAAIPPLFCAKLGSLVWNERVMAVTVEDLGVEKSASPDAANNDEGGKENREPVEGNNQIGQEFISQLLEHIRRRLHITVGTKEEGIMPIEAKNLVEEWRKGNKAGIHSVELDVPVVYGRLKAMRA